MNKKQLIILWLGGLLIVLRLFFPIVEFYEDYQGIRVITYYDGALGIVNIGKTLFQCFALSIFTGLLFITFGFKKSKKNKD